MHWWILLQSQGSAVRLDAVREVGSRWPESPGSPPGQATDLTFYELEMVFCHFGHSSVIAQGRGQVGLSPPPRGAHQLVTHGWEVEQNVLPASVPQGRVLPHPSQNQLQAWEMNSQLGTHVLASGAKGQPAQAPEESVSSESTCTMG